MLIAQGSPNSIIIEKGKNKGLSVCLQTAERDRRGCGAVEAC